MYTNIYTYMYRYALCSDMDSAKYCHPPPQQPEPIPATPCRKGVDEGFFWGGLGGG